MTTKPTPVLAEKYFDRFLSRTEPSSSGCWEWRGRIDVYGYGLMTVGAVEGKRGGNHYKAHRLSYVTFVGPIKDGLTIDHLCRNRCCVNPMHLEAVSSVVNVQRGTSAQKIGLSNRTRIWTAMARQKIAEANRRRIWSDASRQKASETHRRVNQLRNGAA